MNSKEFFWFLLILLFIQVIYSKADRNHLGFGFDNQKESVTIPLRSYNNLIIIETLIRRKPVLYLQYLHENTTEYEKMGACWIIHSETELKEALLSLKDGQKDMPYTDKNVNRWLTEIVYGGRRERNVLQDYEQFIVDCAVEIRVHASGI